MTRVESSFPSPQEFILPATDRPTSDTDDNDSRRRRRRTRTENGIRKRSSDRREDRDRRDDRRDNRHDNRSRSHGERRERRDDKRGDRKDDRRERRKDRRDDGRGRRGDRKDDRRGGTRDHRRSRDSIAPKGNSSNRRASGSDTSRSGSSSKKKVDTSNKPLRPSSGGPSLASNGASVALSEDKFVVNNGYLSPRAALWAYLGVAYIASAGSLSHAQSELRQLEMGENERRAGREMSLLASSDVFALAMFCINAIISLAVSLGYRHGTTRGVITNGPFETILSVVLFVLWCIGSSIIFRPSALYTLNHGGLGDTWDPNLFYSVWISGSLSSYILADLITISSRKGALPIGFQPGNRITKIWILMLFSSTSLFAFCVARRTGPSCSGKLLSATPRCSHAKTGLITGIFGMLLSIGYAAAHKLHSVESISKTMLHLIGLALSLAAIIMYSVNAGITTNPGSSGSYLGNIYVTSWICFFLSLFLGVRYLESFLIPEGTSPEEISGSSHSVRKTELPSYRVPSTTESSRTEDEGDSDTSDNDEESQLTRQLLAPAGELPPPLSSRADRSNRRKRKSGERTSVSGSVVGSVSGSVARSTTPSVSRSTRSNRSSRSARSASGRSIARSHASGTVVMSSSVASRRSGSTSVRSRSKRQSSSRSTSKSDHISSSRHRSSQSKHKSSSESRRIDGSNRSQRSERRRRRPS